MNRPRRNVSNIYSKDSFIEVESEELDSESSESSLDSPLLLEKQKPKEPTDPYLEFKYRNKLQERKGGTRHSHYPVQRLQHLANLAVKLVPIRLDLEIEGVKIRDMFTWNLNETLLSPEMFAQILADDFDSPMAPHFIPEIADQIRKQVSEYSAAVEEDPTGEGESRVEDEEGIEHQDLRIVIKIDIHVGSLCLKDQFEWPLFSTQSYLPEDFAKQMTAELGLGGEFIPMIAHSIREQVCQARINFDDATQAPPWRTRPFRSEGFTEVWGPELKMLKEDELDKISKEKERESRRMRRQRQTERSRRSFANYNRTPAAAIPSVNTPNAFSPYYNGYNQPNFYNDMSGFYPTAGVNTGPSVNNFSNFNQFSPQNPTSPKKIAYKNYQPTENDLKIMQDYVYKFVAADSSLMKTVKKQEVVVDPNLLAKQIEQMQSAPQEQEERSPSPVRNQRDTSPVKKHRGFGASAQMFNADGSIDVGEFRSKWRCSWCLLSGKYTPTLRKGPLGAKTVCNACGIWYGKHGTLPQSRFHEHRDSTS